MSSRISPSLWRWDIDSKIGNLSSHFRKESGRRGHVERFLANWRAQLSKRNAFIGATGSRGLNPEADVSPREKMATYYRFACARDLHLTRGPDRFKRARIRLRKCRSTRVGTITRRGWFYCQKQTFQFPTMWLCPAERELLGSAREDELRTWRSFGLNDDRQKRRRETRDKRERKREGKE